MMERDELVKRRKILSVPYEMVLDCLAPQGVALLRIDIDLPKDYIVLGVNESYMSRTFDFTLAHESFDEVPTGQCAPQIISKLSLFTKNNEGDVSESK